MLRKEFRSEQDCVCALDRMNRNKYMHGIMKYSDVCEIIRRLHNDVRYKEKIKRWNKEACRSAIWSRSVIKHIRRWNPKLSVSAAVGNDYANLHGSVSADGIGDTPWIAWVKAMNNFACSGGQIEGARLTMLLPGNVKESWIKGYMADFNSYAEAKGIQILGGHTQVSEVFARAQFVVTMLGTAGDYCANKKKIKPGYDIVMVGQAGLMGADIILKEKREELHTRFPDFYLDMASVKEDAYSIADAKLA
ncbi:MAG: AIR synthase related protein [Coprococcus sp.]